MEPLKRRLPPEPGWLVASGVLLALAHPPFHLLLPSFVGLVPLLLWLARRPEGVEGEREARRGGFLFGACYFTLVFYWLLTALIHYTPLAILAFLAPVLILAALMGLVAWAIHAAGHRLGWPWWLALPVFWTAAEWLRAHLGDVAFPWMQLGDTLTGYPRLIGAADLVGSRGLSFWLALCNGLVASALLAWRRDGARAVRAPALGLLVALALPIGYSVARWQALELRPAARVGVVQPNVPEDIKLDRTVAADSALRATETLVERALAGEAGRLDLLILPETALPLFVEPYPTVPNLVRPDLAERLGGLARRLESRVLYGALGGERRDGEWSYYNSAFLIDAAGRAAGRYDKRRLVPVVERVPFVDPAWFAGLDYFGGFGVGAPGEPLPADGSSFGVLICYESIYAPLARRHRRAGAEFLVNITNDAWFGQEEPWWSRSSALWQHPAHLVMRAVETRMGVARAANTGISGLVDPLGRISHATRLFTADAFAGTVLTVDGRTLYVRVGDLTGAAAVLAALAAVAALAWHGRR